jgi:ABC-type transport system involved in multi-copper enzyme maturation permease subunit
MTPSNRVLGGGEATFAIARVTMKRTLRGVALWVVLAMSLLPELYGLAALQDHDLQHWPDVMMIWGYLNVLIPPVLLAGMIGEEIEERTIAYLWSRPLPRWSVIAGKLVALVPVLWLILAVAMVIPFYTAVGPEAADHPDLLVHSLLAVVLGTSAAAATTVGLATLAPRFGMVLALGYLHLVDGTLALLDTSISRLSVLHNSLNLAGTIGTEPDYASIGWLIGLMAVWMTVTAWRIRRIE